ncbi:TonB family protein [Halomonas sp. M1]|uniref:energy transducer TonB n=1 Tax=Halomonas sp. M1 TaxID=3035470 RepID=UPI0024856AB7|nr:energy transducer TonB [Halomonas sp. M1]WFE72193.1 TonB family protein [Halomonas sp. M1]
MIRHVLSLSGGVALAVGLFWLLALLVTPPERALETPEMTLSMNMVEAPEVAPEQETPPPQPADAAPAVAPPPMAMPEPPPMAESAITMPEVELPEEPVEPLELDSELPELTEVTPEPTPPTPQPEPAPQAQPEPSPAPLSPTPSTAQREAAPQAEPAPSNEPVSVGQVAPTNRVNPTYPPRAQRRGMEGFVEVAFVIRRDGSVDSSTIQVTNAQPRRVFEDAAREAIARWQFEPSQQLRRATQRIEFQLR